MNYEYVKIWPAYTFRLGRKEASTRRCFQRTQRMREFLCNAKCLLALRELRLVANNVLEHV